MLLGSTDAPLSEESFFQIDQPGVVIDTVKKAEDSDAIIVRLYESYGCQESAILSSSLPVVSATRCNLLEEQDEPVVWRNGRLAFDLGPFQIATYKLNLG